MSDESIKAQEAAARELHCWFDVDRVSKDDQATAWKREARLRQARWRVAAGYPIGSHPHRGSEKVPEPKPVGSRIDLQFAVDSGANFLTPAARRAVVERLENKEPHQTLDADRLYADLLSSMPLCFNLFGDLAADAAAARRAVDAWWPDAPAGPVCVRFEHSPGRLDADFLNNRSAFDVAFEVGGGEQGRGIIGVETKYHEHAAREAEPSEERMARYVEVTERSNVFVPGWREKILGTELQQLWLDHLLVLSMLQHPSSRWSWGRFVLVYPAENLSFAAAAQRYRSLLRDVSTFEARTIEELIVTPGAIAPSLAQAIAERYLG